MTNKNDKYNKFEWATLEIYKYKWVKVHYYIWRSYTGKRKINGIRVPSFWPVYLLGQDETSKKINKGLRKRGYKAGKRRELW